MRFCSRTSHCVSASSLTTAMTRSRGTTAAAGRGPGDWASATAADAASTTASARANNEIIIDNLRILEARKRIQAAVADAQRRIVGGQIAGDAAPQELERARSDAGEPIELELDEHRRGRL